jgi:hypothetical protein
MASVQRTRDGNAGLLTLTGKSPCDKIRQSADAGRSAFVEKRKARLTRP